MTAGDGRSRLGKFTFTEPESITDAQQRLAEIKTLRLDLQTQLGDRNRTHADGTRMSSTEYHQWRGRATRALNGAIAEQRQLQTWIKQHLAEMKQEPSDPSAIVAGADPIELLRQAYMLLVALQAQGAKLQPKEEVLLARIRIYLTNRNR
jgi:hypothetical protein